MFNMLRRLLRPNAGRAGIAWGSVGPFRFQTLITESEHAAPQNPKTPLLDALMERVLNSGEQVYALVGGDWLAIQTVSDFDSESDVVRCRLSTGLEVVFMLSDLAAVRYHTD